MAILLSKQIKGNNMKKILQSALTVFILIGLIACGNSNDPKSIVENFYQNIASKKFDKAINMIYLGDLKDSEMTKARDKIVMMISVLSEEIEKAGGLKSIEIKQIKLSKDGKKATVEHIVHLNKKDIKENMKLIQDNGKWKIQIH